MPRKGNSARELRTKVYAGAFGGAVGTLDEMSDAEVQFLTQYGGIVGVAARWLLDYRAEQTETKRRVSEALRDWRENGRG